MRSLERGRSWRVVGCLVLAAWVAATQVSAAPSPLGPQRVIVIPINLGTSLAELCPYHGFPALGRPCPFDSNTAMVYQAPRHTAHEWETLLNDYGRRYWQLASYGQAQAGFTVLESPYSQDGWWTPPHVAQDYENNGDFYVDNKFWAYVEDPARGAIDAICAQPLPSYQFFCSTLGQYDRIIVMTNKKARGGVSNSTNGLSTITVNTLTQGNLAFTATLANESTSDSDALSVVMHEFGHQLGMPTHYGSQPLGCSPWYIPSFNGFLECLGNWDIMAYDWAWSQPTGYSRLSRGWIDPNSTLSYELRGTPFSTLTFIRPVSQAPNGVPNLIRLPFTGLGWPMYLGYLAECRRRINGDEGLFPGSPGISEGLLITFAHETSLLPIVLPAAPPLHVVRPSSPPAADPSLAVLKPGDSFSDPQHGLFIRLNGYAGDDAEPLCDVEVDYLEPPRTGPILLWQNRVAPEPIPSFRSFDVGMNHPLPADAAVSGANNQPLVVEPLWAGHNNALFVRAHTLGTLPAENVKLNVSITQPALITSTCGALTDRDAREVSLPLVDPARGASATLGFRPHRGSLGVLMYAPADAASDRDASNAVSSRVAFQFFPAGRLWRQRTHFVLRANDGCAGTTTFHVSPAFVSEGWKVSVSPEVVALAPGAETDVAVTVKPPDGAQPGQSAEIGIDVLQAEEASRPAPTDQPLDPRLQQHLDSVGSMQISARVVGEPAAVSLSCTAAAPRGGGVSVSGNITPSAPNSTVMLEYTALGAAETRFVTTDPTGTFTDSFAPSPRHGHVQAFWPGDATHAPAQSRRCEFLQPHRRRVTEAP